MFYLPESIKDNLTSKFDMRFNQTSGMLDNFFDVVKNSRKLKVFLEDGSKLKLNYAQAFYVSSGKLTFVVIITEHCGYYYFDSRMIDRIK